MALRLVGAHQVGNALAAAAVALECGATPEGVAAALSGAAPASRWRMEVTDRPDGVTVINDAYNANPESMRAALQALASVGSGSASDLGRARPDGRARRAVRGRPRRDGRRRRRAGRGPARDGRPPPSTARGRAVADVAGGRSELLHAELEPGDVVLVKASRAAGLDRLADALLVTRPQREPVA